MSSNGATAQPQPHSSNSMAAGPAPSHPITVPQFEDSANQHARDHAGTSVDASGLGQPPRGGSKAPPSKRKATGRVCVECGATSTPQWREGPAGPKTLCNACGVRRMRGLSKSAAAAVEAAGQLASSPSAPRSRSKSLSDPQAPLQSSRAAEHGSRPVRQAALAAISRTAAFARTGEFPDEPTAAPAPAANHNRSRASAAGLKSAAGSHDSSHVSTDSMDEGPIEGRLGGAAHGGVGLGAELHGLGGAPLQPLLALSSIAELRLQALHKEQATLGRHDAAAVAAGLQAAKTRTGPPTSSGRLDAVAVKHKPHAGADALAAATAWRPVTGRGLSTKGAHPSAGSNPQAVQAGGPAEPATASIMHDHADGQLSAVVLTRVTNRRASRPPTSASIAGLPLLPGVSSTTDDAGGNEQASTAGTTQPLPAVHNESLQLQRFEQAKECVEAASREVAAADAELQSVRQVYEVRKEAAERARATAAQAGRKLHEYLVQMADVHHVPLPEVTGTAGTADEAAGSSQVLQDVDPLVVTAVAALSTAPAVEGAGTDERP